MCSLHVSIRLEQHLNNVCCRGQQYMGLSTWHNGKACVISKWTWQYGVGKRCEAALEASNGSRQPTDKR